MEKDYKLPSGRMLNKSLISIIYVSNVYTEMLQEADSSYATYFTFDFNFVINGFDDIKTFKMQYKEDEVGAQLDRHAIIDLMTK